MTLGWKVRLTARVTYLLPLLLFCESPASMFVPDVVISTGRWASSSARATWLVPPTCLREENARELSAIRRSKVVLATYVRRRGLELLRACSLFYGSLSLSLALSLSFSPQYYTTLAIPLFLFSLFPLLSLDLSPRLSQYISLTLQ